MELISYGAISMKYECVSVLLP